jgi:hypothetical protein
MDVVIFNFLFAWICIVGAIIGGNPSCVGVGVRCFKVEICSWWCLCEFMIPLLHEHYLYMLGFNSPRKRFKINHWIE